jgi:hypothetical protein
MHSGASADGTGDADIVRACDAAQLDAIGMPACCRLILLALHLAQIDWM